MSKESKNAAVASPCIGVCVLSLENICEGCFRSAEEITVWTGLDEQGKRKVLENTWRRARESGVVL